MVAQYADESNLTSPPDELPRKLEVLAAHCERLGRDRSEITVSQHLNVCIEETHDDAEADLRAFLGARGIDLDAADEALRAMILALVICGDPDEVGERLSAILDIGVDGVTMSCPANGHEIEPVELLGTTATKVLGLP